MTVLLPREVSDDPIATFGEWFKIAKTAQIYLPDAMALATSDKKGHPSVRMVLLKGWSKAGFCFYTNYDSPKAIELIKNPHAALCFHWAALEKQIRIEGRVKKLSRAQSESYHKSRPRGSQLAAWASKQSTVIDSRDELLNHYKILEQKFENKAVKCPPNWGGFILVPERIEFWLGRLNRLHERALFEKSRNGKWRVQLLAP